MFSLVRQTIVVFVVLTLLTGFVYPLAMTGLAQVIFPHQANGSLIECEGKIVGSELIGQQFDDPKYFWSRPSATSPAYNAAASTGSNLGPTNPTQLQAVSDRVKSQRKANASDTPSVPIDLVTASGSGLDPHISPASAEYQIDRIAKARNIDTETVKRLVAEHTAGRQFGILGEPRVSVLELNLALDAVNK